MAPTPQQQRRLTIQSSILLVFLAVQYALGMYVNLFVSFPDGAEGGVAWEFSWSQFPIAAHIILGFLLGTGAIAFLVRAIRYQSAEWKTPAILGLVAIACAAVGGSLFIPSQIDAYSYLMSAFFLLAFFSYAWGLARQRTLK